MSAHTSANATVLLKPGEADRVLAGHPWIYKGSVMRVTRTVEDGEIVQVKDARQRFLGQGFYNSRSRISVRMVSTGKEPIDEAHFRSCLEKALRQRRSDMPKATSFRWVNSESDFLSGLIMDVYGKTVVFQITSLGMERRKPMIVSLIHDIFRPENILERGDPASRIYEGLESFDLRAHKGELPTEIVVELNNNRFGVQLASGHKTGLYLDQQENYRLVAEMLRGARCLDCFSFIGGFSIHAAKAGVSEVLGIDQSQQAVDQAQANAALNGVSANCSFICANVFDWLKDKSRSSQNPRSDRPFDAVILDPPSFTRSRKTIPEALRGYKEIHLRALHLLKPGGLLFSFCCSHHVDGALFQEVIASAAADARARLRRIRSFSQSLDHPIIPGIPESEYLKGFAFQVIS